MEAVFVPNSSAEFQGLFCMAQYVFCENRCMISPIVLASIMLKLNERFWDIELVSEAINAGRVRCTTD